MKHFISSLLIGLALGLGSTAMANDAPQTATPAPVDQALKLAEAIPDFRPSFTMEFIWKDLAPVTQRYDATAGSWTTLEGNPKALPKAARKKLKTWKKNETLPSGLLYGDFRPHMKNITLREEQGDRLSYDFNTPRMAKDLDKAKELMTTSLVVNQSKPRAPYIAEYRITALKPFKPNAAAKLEAFDFQNIFEPVFADYPPLLTKASWVAKGKGPFKEIDDQFKIRFFDFVKH